MSFLQDAPQLPHPLQADPWLTDLLTELPDARRAALDPDLNALADYALMAFARCAHSTPEIPRFTPWDAWGRRVDRIELTTAWREGAAITANHAVLAAGHDPQAGVHARLEQFIRVYLYHVPSQFYTCPLAMTDGAATAIKASGNQALARRALPHFLSRDPARLWLSGQWMTETIGGSDVGHSQTHARRDGEGQWRLYGRKWFTSAIVGEAALALARPEGGADGAAGLALFYVQTRDAQGRWDGITIDRIKDKLGTRELPTAEIHLDGAPAWPLGELGHGVRQIVPMLTITRTWNAICAVASMRRCLALSTDYARRRQAFGQRLIDQPLHARTLADGHAELAGAFALAFQLPTVLGQVENGQGPAHAPALLRLLTPLAKLWTGKLATRIASETLECFGGNGYIEDTGLPQLLRDAQVYSIWEGTTNVLSLDLLRALLHTGTEPLRAGIEAWLAPLPATPQVAAVHAALDHATRHLTTLAKHRLALESCARGLALTLARTCAAALLCRRAHDHPQARVLAARDLFLAHGLERLPGANHAATTALLGTPAATP